MNTATYFSTNACADDVAVIDEAQMIQHNERGFAWTRVILGKITCLYKYLYIFHRFLFLLYVYYVHGFTLVYMSGLPAKEIHICGSGIAVNVVKKIVDSVGEQIEVKYYDRLLPLVTLNDSLGKHGY